MLYDNYLQKLSNKISRRFDDILAEYNFDYGPEFEIALCKVLREFLPNKYGICRGFVVSSEGEKEGDDIIIFDQEKFPTLRLLQTEDYSIKEQIPIESVYAYIEAKHTLTEETFSKAISQIINVKKLCHKRDKQKLYQIDPYVDTNLRPPMHIPHLPEYRNPIFSMIFSRFGVANNYIDTLSINEFLKSALNKLSKDNYEFFPELIIAGNNNFLSTAYKKEGENKPTLFHLAEREGSSYQVIMLESMTYGLAFAHLFASLDWIRLGKMPWENIINETKEFGTSKLDSPLNEKINTTLEINFDENNFTDGTMTIVHNKGYTPQVSVLLDNGEEVMTAVKKNEIEVEIGVNGNGFKGKLIIT
jgi:hypothetical protein